MQYKPAGAEHTTRPGQDGVRMWILSLGSATVQNVPASVSPNMSVGLLGLSFFNHFTYNIDGSRNPFGGFQKGRSESGVRPDPF